MTFVSFLRKPWISFNGTFKRSHKFPVRITDSKDILRPYSGQEGPGRMVTKHLVQTRQLGDPVYGAYCGDFAQVVPTTNQ